MSSTSRLTARQYARRGMIAGWAVVVGAIATFTIQSCSAAGERQEATQAAVAAPDYKDFYVDICQQRGACAALQAVVDGREDGSRAYSILVQYQFTDGVANDTAVNDALGRYGLSVQRGYEPDIRKDAAAVLDLIND